MYIYFVKRAAAALVDMTVAALAASVLDLVVPAPYMTDAQNFLLQVVLFWTYMLWVQAKLGTSIGKRLLGLRLATLHSEGLPSPGVWPILVRYLPYMGFTIALAGFELVPAEWFTDTVNIAVSVALGAGLSTWIVVDNYPLIHGKQRTLRDQISGIGVVVVGAPAETRPSGVSQAKGGILRRRIIVLSAFLPMLAAVLLVWFVVSGIEFALPYRAACRTALSQNPRVVEEVFGGSIEVYDYDDGGRVVGAEPPRGMFTFRVYGSSGKKGLVNAHWHVENDSVVVDSFVIRHESIMER